MTAHNTGGRPKLLDLFCGDGGAGEGYHRAGFDVTGVDIDVHAYPCGRFIQADALDVMSTSWFLRQFDVIHASPPCQGSTTMSAKYPAARALHPKLIAPVRELLLAWGGTYVIENVGGAKRELRNPIVLHGGSFGLNVSRPRLFESNAALLARPFRRAVDPIGVYGRSHDGRRLWTRADGSILRAARTLAEGRAAMGIDWMSWADLTEAIPPAFTEFIGAQLIESLVVAA